LLEAFLVNPVKCHLLSEEEESYRRDGILKLTSQETSPDIASPEPGLRKHESWGLAIGETVRAQGWGAEVARIQRIHWGGTPIHAYPFRNESPRLSDRGCHFVRPDLHHLDGRRS
jgi:hypothetical protein